MCGLLASHYGWTPDVIDGLYWDVALDYATQAQDRERDNYRWMLDISAAAFGDGYKEMRRVLTGKNKPKVMVPTTEAEVRAMMKGGKDVV